MIGPFEARKMVPGSDAYFACGHEHPTTAEARDCRDALWPASLTSFVRPISHRPPNLTRCAPGDDETAAPVVEDHHEGRAVYRFTKTHCLKLCPVGHLISATALDPRRFPGSAMEAEAAGTPPMVRCFGAMPT